MLDSYNVYYDIKPHDLVPAVEEKQIIHQDILTIYDINMKNLLTGFFSVNLIKF